MPSYSSSCNRHDIMVKLSCFTLSMVLAQGHTGCARGVSSSNVRQVTVGRPRDFYSFIILTGFVCIDLEKIPRSFVTNGTLGSFQVIGRGDERCKHHALVTQHFSRAWFLF